MNFPFGGLDISFDLVFYALFKYDPKSQNKTVLLIEKCEILQKNRGRD